MTGTQLIARERRRQKTVEGWTPEHDAQHCRAELARVAVCYTRQAIDPCRAGCPPGWPDEWSLNWWKPSDDPIRNLVKAGALIAAQIDRLQRMAGNAAARGAAEPDQGRRG